MSSVASVSSEVPFVELIRAREAQQQRIREALEQQNRQLRERLGAKISDESSTVPAAEFVRFVGEVKDLVSKAHEADVAAFHSLQDRFEKHAARLSERIQDIEARVAASNKELELCRLGEALAHQQTISQLDELRGQFGLLEKRLVARDDSSSHSAVLPLAASLQSMEQRLVEAELVPAALRHNIADLEARHEKLSELCEEERAKAQIAQTRTSQKNEARLTQIVAEAENQLLCIGEAAKTSNEMLVHQKSHIHETIDAKIEDVRWALQTTTVDKVGECVDKATTVLSEQKTEYDALVANLKSLATNVGVEVSSAIRDLKKSHGEVIDEKLKEMTRKAEEHESKRRAEFPTLDADRVDLMISELEGAFTLIEGAARNKASGVVPPTRDCPHSHRISRLETQVKALTSFAPSDVDTKVAVSMDTQTKVGGGGDSTADRMNRNLQLEMERATSEHAARHVNHIVDVVARTASKSPYSPGVRGVSGPQIESLADLQFERKKKEAIVEKIQGVLKDIHSKFEELTRKESQALGRDTKDKVKLGEVIAKQKESIFDKERMLVDQRNKLIREIAGLREKEMGISR